MEIYVARDGQRTGPFPLEEVRRQLAAGAIQPDDLAWMEGAAEWMPVSSLPGLAVAPPPPLPPTTPRPAGYPPPAAGGPPETSGLAIASLVMGILSVTLIPLLPAIPAVVCGHIARGKIKESAGALGGSGMALAGLIMGYIGVAILPLIAMVAILAGIALPVFAEVKARGLETKSLSQARQIGLACGIYAQDHQGAFPPTLEQLIPDYLPTRELFICPISGPSVPVGYYYYGGKETDPARQVLLASKAVTKTKRRVIIYVDLSGEVTRNAPVLPAQ